MCKQWRITDTPNGDEEYQQLNLQNGWPTVIDHGSPFAEVNQGRRVDYAVFLGRLLVVDLHKVNTY